MDKKEWTRQEINQLLKDLSGDEELIIDDEGIHIIKKEQS